MTATNAAGQPRSRELNEVIVTGTRIQRLPLPERSIGALDIPSYGLGTIGELISEIAAETGDPQSDTIILVDGRRVAGLRSVEDYPTEALERVDLLLPGSGAAVGASPARRVYNLILKPTTRVAVASASAKAATEGGWSGLAADGSLTAITRPRRINLTIGSQNEQELRESARNLVQLAGSDPGIAEFRSLRPARERLRAGFSAADELAPWLHGEINVKVDAETTRFRLGRSSAGEPIVQRSRGRLGSADMLLEAEWGTWLINLGALYRADRRRTATSPNASDVRLDKVSTVNRQASLEWSANGPVLDLPAGALRLSLGAEIDRTSVRGRAAGGVTEFRQTQREVRVGLDIPIASKANAFLAPLGEIAAGVELRRGNISRFGRLAGETFSLRWEPNERIRLFGSISDDRSPPSVGLLGDPAIRTPGTRYFDALRGETVDVVLISGGNASLAAPRVSSRRLSLQVRPLRKVDLTLTTEYGRTDSRNLVASLPSASAFAFAAFPDRFIRDAAGRLIEVDIRPVNFARQTEEQLRSELQLTVPLPRRNQARAGRGSGRRISVSASHMLLLNSALIVRRGDAPVDLLSSDAIGLGGAARPRHQFDLGLNYAERGLGVRLSASRRSASFLDIDDGTGPSALRFEPLTVLSVRAFAEGGRLAPASAWLKGSRFTLSIVNLANARETVVDSRDVTPLAYQPVYRDPIGRTIELEFRKTF